MHSKQYDLQEIYVEDEARMLSLGNEIAQVCEGGLLIYLFGDLGAGKTTLTRGILQGLGFEGHVKSPTYTVVESYVIDGDDGDLNVFHFDLYRLADPEELEYMGLRDFFEESQNIIIIEWPEKGGSILPEPDLEIRLEFEDNGRKVILQALTERGMESLQALNMDLD